MKIKELSNLLNVSQKTIRYYEGCGFIMPLTQNKSGRIFRDYDEAAITQLKTIIGLRKLRFSIDEIKDLFAEPEKLAEICNTHRNNLDFPAEPSRCKSRKKILSLRPLTLKSDKTMKHAYL